MENAIAVRTASLIHESARTLTKLLDQHLASREVTAQQAALLINLANGESGPTRLAAALATDTAGVTRLADRLETKGLLRRQRATGDRRAVVLELTAAGRRLAPHLVPTYGSGAAALFEDLSEGEVRQLGDLLDRALASMRSDHGR